MLLYLGEGLLAKLNNPVRDDVQRLCARLGRDPLLVQGPGGNASWKDDTALWVKASGTWLAHAEDREIFVPVDLAHLRGGIAAGQFERAPRVLLESAMRPSIETILHALLPQRIVLHVHAVDALAHLVRRRARQLLGERLSGLDGWVFVDYFKPGASLARGVADALAGSPDAEFVMLANHGLIVGADDVAALEAKLSLLLEKLRPDVPVWDIKQPADTPAEILLDAGYRLVSDPVIQQLALQDALVHRLEADWALYPDHVVFLGASAPVLASMDAGASLDEALQKRPAYLIVKNRGVYELDSVGDTHRAQMRCYADVLMRQAPGEALQTLDSTQIAEILNWDAEKFRQNLAEPHR